MSDTSRAVQSLNMARGFKFRILKEEVWYYPCSEVAAQRQTLLEVLKKNRNRRSAKSQEVLHREGNKEMLHSKLWPTGTSTTDTKSKKRKMFEYQT